MADRKAFLVRLDPALHEALQRWADADLRSLNAQIEFLLRGALRGAGRLPAPVREQERENAPQSAQHNDDGTREK
jgi:hypothetical protein